MSYFVDIKKLCIFIRKFLNLKENMHFSEFQNQRILYIFLIKAKKLYFLFSIPTLLHVKSEEIKNRQLTISL